MIQIDVFICVTQEKQARTLFSVIAAVYLWPSREKSLLKTCGFEAFL